MSMDASHLMFVENILSFEAFKRRDEAKRCREAYKDERGERIAKIIERSAEVFEAERAEVLRELEAVQAGVSAPAG